MWRKSQDYMAAWYAKPHRKPILIRGARQVGKTTLVKIVAEQLKLTLININLEQPLPILKDLKTNHLPTIIQGIELQYKINLKTTPCLLFFDEIQVLPALIGVLRYFYEQYPELAVIGAGSLLEFELSELKFPMPVGRTEFLHLGPMDFEEFLNACGENQLLDYMSGYELNSPFSFTAHEQLLNLLKHYLLIGGMPEAVKLWVETHQLSEVFDIKYNLVTNYVLDFNKYKTVNNVEFLTKVFKNVPAMVGEKAKYVRFDRNNRAKKVAEAIHQLSLARIISPVYHTSSNGLPLAAEKDFNIFKLLFLDVGLMLAELGLVPNLIFHAEELNLVNDGKIAEQFIGQHLLFRHRPLKQPELFYWVKEGRSNAEIDYIIDVAGKIFPVEVKAGKTGTLRSLHQFMLNKKLTQSVRFFSGLPVLDEIKTTLPNGEVSYQLISLPHYLVGQLHRLLEEKH